MDSTQIFSGARAHLDNIFLVDGLENLLPAQVCEFTSHKFVKNAQPLLVSWMEQRIRAINEQNKTSNTAA